jgi:hypothetical protein
MVIEREDAADTVSWSRNATPRPALHAVATAVSRRRGTRARPRAKEAPRSIGAQDHGTFRGPGAPPGRLGHGASLCAAVIDSRITSRRKCLERSLELVHEEKPSVHPINSAMNSKM